MRASANGRVGVWGRGTSSGEVGGDAGTMPPRRRRRDRAAGGGRDRAALAASVRPVVEALEERRLLAITFTAAADQTVEEGTNVSLADVRFTDPGFDADGHTLTVDWGDGTTPRASTASLGGDEDGNVYWFVSGRTHAYPPGQYTIHLTATDVADPTRFADATLVATVNQAAPVIAIGTAAARVRAGEAVTLTPTLRDPGGNHVAAWDVDWGDGQTSQYPTPDFTLPTPTHTYAAPGTYPIAVTPHDGDFPTLPAVRPTFDSGFGPAGGGGRVVLDFPNWSTGGPGGSDTASAVAADAAGRTIVGGRTSAGVAVARLTAAGAPDATFGPAGTGKVVVSFGTNPNGTPAYNNWTSGVAVQADGRILLAGDVNPAAAYGVDHDFTLVRLNPDGTPDATFGPAQNGRVVTDFGANVVARPNALAVDPATGRITLVGFAGADLAIARYNADGTPDATFDGDGRLTANLGSTADIGYAVAIDPQGRVVAAGSVGDDFFVARFLPDGTPDASFDATGRRVVDVGAGDKAYGVSLDPLGRVVVGGESDGHYALLRLTGDGQLDTTFNGTGALVDARFATAGSPRSYFFTVLAQDDGRILAGGGDRASALVVARYAEDGQPDPTFGGAADGVVRTAIPQPSVVAEFRALGVLSADGKITAAGTTFNQAEGVGVYNFSVARYLPDNRVTVGDAPAAPGGLVATVAGPDRVDLRWTRHSVDELGFRVERRGDDFGEWTTVGVVGAGVSAYADAGLRPGSAYRYRVCAYDAGGTSDYATLAADVRTAAAAPTDVTAPALTGQVTLRRATYDSLALTWPEPAAAQGVSYYEVRRDGAVVAYRTVTNFTDTGLAANTAYTYAVRAFDAAGNASAPISPVGSPRTAQRPTDQSYGDTQTPPPSAPPPPSNADLASEQFVPQAWEDYFYDVLTPALRNRFTGLPFHALSVARAPGTSGWAPVAPPPARHYLDRADLVLDLGPSGVPSGPWRRARDLLKVPEPVRFVDLDGDGHWNQTAEPAWIDANLWDSSGNYLSTTNAFDPYDRRIGGGGGPLKLGTQADAQAEFVYHDLADPAHVSESELLEVELPDVRSTGPGDLLYYDANGNGTFDASATLPTESVWHDVNGNHVFDAGDQVVYDAGRYLTAAAASAGNLWGKRGGLEYYQNGGIKLLWKDESVLAESNNPDYTPWLRKDQVAQSPGTAVSLRADLWSFYRGLEYLAPFYAAEGGDGAATWDLPSFLDAVAGPAPVPDGQVRVAATSERVPYDSHPQLLGLGTTFTRDVRAGDLLTMADNDGGTSQLRVLHVNDDTHLTYVGVAGWVADTARAFRVHNWTRVPELPAYGLSAVHGEFVVNGLLTPAHFAELAEALGKLSAQPNVYGVARYTDDSGLQAAKQLLAIEVGVYGPQDPGAIGLRDAIELGRFDPGAVNDGPSTFRNVLDNPNRLYGLGIMQRTLVRGDTPGGNGWKLVEPYDPNLSPTLADPNDLTHPPAYTIETFDTPEQRARLLPAAPRRAAGAWTDLVYPKGAFAPAADPQHLQEILQVMAALRDNGLWISDGIGWPSATTTTTTATRDIKWWQDEVAQQPSLDDMQLAVNDTNGPFDQSASFPFIGGFFETVDITRGWYPDGSDGIARNLHTDLNEGKKTVTFVDPAVHPTGIGAPPSYGATYKAFSFGPEGEFGPAGMAGVHTDWGQPVTIVQYSMDDMKGAIQRSAGHPQGIEYRDAGTNFWVTWSAGRGRDGGRRAGPGAGREAGEGRPGADGQVGRTRVRRPGLHRRRAGRGGREAGHRTVGREAARGQARVLPAPPTVGRRAELRVARAVPPAGPRLRAARIDAPRHAPGGVRDRHAGSTGELALKFRTRSSRLMRLIGDRVVLGEATTLRRPSWEAPEELIASGAVRREEGRIGSPPPFKKVGLSILVRQYLKLPQDNEMKHLVVRVSDVGLDSPGAAWLALNPDFGRILEWRLDPEGLFRWRSSDGELMVETLWWTDSKVEYPPYVDDEEVGEGWVVLCSKKALSMITDQLGPIDRAWEITRTFREQRREYMGSGNGIEEVDLPS